MANLKDLPLKYARAVLDKNVSDFAAIFDESVRVFDMWNKWSYSGLIAWREMADGWFKSLGEERCVVEFKEIEANETNDLGYLSAYVTFSGVSKTGEKLRSMQNRISWVARKIDGSWKVVHEHTSAPVHSDTMKVDLTPNPEV